MIQTIYKAYCKIEDVLVGIGFFSIIVLTFTNAVLRTMKHPITFVDDINMLLFGWVAFMGADVAMRYSRLVGMDILTNKLPPKSQKVMQIMVYLIMITALAFFCQYGFALALGNWKRNFNSLAISYGWVTLSLPVCSVMMILTALTKIGKIVSHFKEDDYNVRKDNPDLVGEEYTGLDEDPQNII